MIGADGRGQIAGHEVASSRSEQLPEQEIESLAQKMLAKMRAAGYAHLDPESDFIRGFCQGYHEYFLLRGASR
jgi:hypothetical protein